MFVPKELPAQLANLQILPGLPPTSATSLLAANPATGSQTGLSWSCSDFNPTLTRHQTTSLLSGGHPGEDLSMVSQRMDGGSEEQNPSNLPGCYPHRGPVHPSEEGLG